VGLLYDDAALDAAWDMVKDWTAEERQSLRDSVGKLGFKTPFRKTNVRELARQMLEISTAGLRRRASLDSAGMSEDGFLTPLRELVTRGQSRAEELLHAFQNEWKGDVSRLFSEYNFL
jgi:glutamate--cysteine ligase